MTMLASEPAICKKCGNRQYYTKVITWNMGLNPEYPAHNKCYECGEELKYDDIDMATCSPNHRSDVRYHKIYERLSEKGKNKNTDKIICPECGSEKVSFVSECGIKLPDKYKDMEGYSVSKSWRECQDCGYKDYDTLDKIMTSDIHEFVENGENEHEYIVKDVENIDEIMREFQRKMREEQEEIEDELISEGLITTREEEKEYRDKYYEELHRKYGQ